MSEELSKAVVRSSQVVAIIAPAIYTGFTFAYSHVVIPPLATHAPPKLLAKQWLQAYQFAPVFVAPLILTGTIANAAMAYLTRSARSRVQVLYAAAALATATIIPYTALYMEPGVNGAGKWKVQELLSDEGFELQQSGQGTDTDTANQKAKHWADSVDMKTIVQSWASINSWRYVITAVATLLSAIATVRSP
ncbi:hypothetical protein ACN47E_000160 [Coniothyrium glycines]